MNLRFVERDGKKILQELHGYETWVDVPCVEEKKEQRKMWQVINTMAQLSSAHPTGEVYWHQLASATIDAVIECYEDYMSSPRKIDFKNWLTQRLL